MLPEIKSIGMALTPQWFLRQVDMVSILKTMRWKLVGIHGEKGLHRESIQPINQIISTLVEKLEQEISADDYIVMVNGMGGTPQSELNIVTKYLSELFNDKHYGETLVRR